MGLRFPSSMLLLLLTIVLLHGPCSSQEEASYTTITQDATSAPPVLSEYDYIIIGGGTAGCALAATLSESATVLLLERGGLPRTDPGTTSITGVLEILFDISPASSAQLFVSTDGVINHRARVLGGGTAINFGFFSRASRDYVSRAGWDQNLVKKSYDWVEKKVAFWPTVAQWQSAFRNGLIEAGVTPYNGMTTEHIYGTKVGKTIFDEERRRHTAAELLDYADVSNIVVYLRSTVHRILFTGQGQNIRANGVIFEDKNGNQHIAYLKNNSKSEIILTAGAIGSPQLLMLSGVGPAQHLRTHKIEVILDQPLVGQGMVDNPLNGLLIPSPKPVENSIVQVVGIARPDNFIEGGSQSFDLSRFLNMALQLGLPFNQNYIKSLRLNSTFDVGMIVEKFSCAISTGFLELLTKDPNDNPKVTFNYFKEPQDLQRCVQGMSTIIKVIESESFSAFRYPLTPIKFLHDLMAALPLNFRRRSITDTFTLENYCKATKLTFWHYHGGCQVGRVVDRSFRVLGINSLRVIDASTFNFSPGTNPQATIMMLGRYMGQQILEAR